MRRSSIACALGDPTDGGESHRYSLSADWISRRGAGELRARGYVIDYRLDLFSNFTYAFDPDNGDQFEQLDDRRILGGAVEWQRPLMLGDVSNELALGVEFRRDDIDRVGLYRTVARERIGTSREDAVVQTSYSAYSSLTTTWTDYVRTSVRRGVEVGAIWNPASWLIVDADLAWSRSRFGGARFRHFGNAPLIEDGRVESDPTTLVNLEAGYHISDTLQVSAAVFNVFDSNDNDITYFYESQLQGEAAAVEDIHFHPVEPRTVRFTLTGKF